MHHLSHECTQLVPCGWQQLVMFGVHWCPEGGNRTLQCGWGWDRSDRQGESAPDYIKRMLTDFRTGSFPIDSFISDFEWCDRSRRKLA